MAIVGDESDGLPRGEHTMACRKLCADMACAEKIENPRGLAGCPCVCSASGQRRIRGLDHGAQEYPADGVLFANHPVVFEV